MNSNRLLCALLLVVFGKVTAEDQKFQDTWHNELNSEMIIKVDAQGHVSGTYQSWVGEGDHQPKELVGFVKGDQISFTAFFSDVGSICAWVGHLDASGKIQTLWHLGFRAKEGWDGTLAGADVFERGASPLHEKKSDDNKSKKEDDDKKKKEHEEKKGKDDK